GCLWEAYQQHYGRDGDPIFVWQAPTEAMNPKVDPQIIADAYAKDEAEASAEYGAQFRRDLEAFVSRETLQACIVPDRHELPPLRGTRYCAFTDPSGGSADSWTLAIAHGEKRDKTWVVVLDAVRETRSPFSPDAVVADYAALLKTYRVTKIVGDRYAGEFPRELFRKHGIAYVPSEKPKSELYLETLPALKAHRIELLDLPRLIQQFLGLERRTSRAGRDSVDHAPRSHDDLVNSVAGACVHASDG